ncbi:MAG: hypothetical protein ABDH37_00910 [Candidatus Hydrothermales bacterium]
MKLLAFFVILHYINVDGNPSDWIGTPPSLVHDFTFSGGEFIYKGDFNDFRTDLGNTLYLDITEFRLTCDNTWIYFLIKFNDIGPFDRDLIHIEISLGNPNDPTRYEWIGDDAQLGLTRRALADRIIALHSTTPSNFNIEMWDGGVWYAPPTPGYLAVVSDIYNCVEARISLNDVADGSLILPSVIRISLVSFKNNVGWNNDIDATADIGGIPINDGIDVMGGKKGVSENAWFRDLSDNLVNSFFDILLKRNGDARNFKRIVDGSPTDWIGSLPSQIHEVIYSKREWIYRGDIGDMREDPHVPDDSVFDLKELRLTVDSVNLYILAKFHKMDFQETQIALSVDKDQNQGDDLLKINGDDTGTNLSQSIQYSEREVILTADSVNHAEIFLFADDGSLWYTPVSPYRIVIDPINKTIEGRILLSDLSLKPNDTIILSGASYDANVQGIGNSPNGSDNPATPQIEEGDMSVDYMVCDALDVIGGNVGVSQNSWIRDLQDGDLDFYYTVYLQNILQPLGFFEEFVVFENKEYGILIRYSIDTEDEIEILKKQENGEYYRIFSSKQKDGVYLDKDVIPSKVYFYLLKSGDKIFGPYKVIYQRVYEKALKIYNFDFIYLPEMKNLIIFDVGGRGRLMVGEKKVRLYDFRNGVYFIRDRDKTYKVLKVR